MLEDTVRAAAFAFKIVTVPNILRLRRKDSALFEIVITSFQIGFGRCAIWQWRWILDKPGTVRSSGFCELPQITHGLVGVEWLVRGLRCDFVRDAIGTVRRE